jgi:hypothetical protein
MFENITKRFINETRAQLLTETSVENFCYLISLATGKSICVDDIKTEPFFGFRVNKIVEQCFENNRDIFDNYVLNFKGVVPLWLYYRFSENFLIKSLKESEVSIVERIKNCNDYKNLFQNNFYSDSELFEIEQIAKELKSDHRVVDNGCLYNSIPADFLIHIYFSLSFNEINNFVNVPLSCDLSPGSPFDQLFLTVLSSTQNSSRIGFLLRGENFCSKMKALKKFEQLREKDYITR